MTSWLLTAVISRRMVVVSASVLGVGWAILQRIYPIRLYIFFIFFTNEKMCKTVNPKRVKKRERHPRPSRYFVLLL